MSLSDGDIRRRLAEGNLEIAPLADPDLQIQPGSVDLRLGRELLEFQDVAEVSKLSLDDEEALDAVTNPVVMDDGTYVMEPGEFLLGTTQERVQIPTDLQGGVDGRSSVGRLGMTVHVTAGVIDSGYSGEITLELKNLGEYPVELASGMRICQLELKELSSPAERPYGSERGSKYQGQSGPTRSQISNDPEFTD